MLFAIETFDCFNILYRTCEIFEHAFKLCGMSLHPDRKVGIEETLNDGYEWNCTGNDKGQGPRIVESNAQSAQALDNALNCFAERGGERQLEVAYVPVRVIQKYPRGFRASAFAS